MNTNVQCNVIPIDVKQNVDKKILWLSHMNLTDKPCWIVVVTYYIDLHFIAHILLV